MIDPPVVGWRIGSGQLEKVAEDGVATAPIISIAFIRLGEDVDDELQEYTLGAAMVPEFTKALADAGDHSIAQWHPRLREEEERYRRKDRRLTIIGAVLIGTLGLALCVSTGFAGAQTYTHHGGVAPGVLAGVTEAWQLLGLVAFWRLLILGARWLKARKRVEKKPALTPLDDRL